MKKSIAISVMCLTVCLTVCLAGGAITAAHAQENPLNAVLRRIPQVTQQDGFAILRAQGDSGINGLISFEDNGAANVITGYATGMDPTKVYVSLVYDVNSVPTGQNACLPTPGDNSLSFNQMIVGVWLPIGSSTRTLTVVKTGPDILPQGQGPLAYFALRLAGTVSIRQDTQPGQPIPAAPAPGRFLLKSCGKVRLVQQGG